MRTCYDYFYLGHRIIESFENVTSQYAQSINATINFINPSVSITAENVSIDARKLKLKLLGMHHVKIDAC